MGRFASHLKIVTESTQPCSFTGLEYTFVDYARLGTLAKDSSASAFREAWDEELKNSSSNFDEHYQTSTKVMMDAIFDGSDEDYGPNHPAFSSDPREPLEVLMRQKGREFVLNLFTDFKVLLQTASLNAEALHLALKKYDKYAAKTGNGLGMMRDLLPKLYASTTYHATGTRSLAGELQVVRDLIEEDDKALAMEMEEMDGKRLSETAEDAKEDELIWFKENCAKQLGEKELASLVAHRGFHCEKDDSVSRPIENSLSSFEWCWAAGVHLAECDVGATKDDKIIMAHDEDFSRLALLSSDERSKLVVKDLTLADIMRMPLKHGSRPPLLVDVLRSAMAIGEHAKLVIEVKPGNSEIVEPLMMLFNRHPTLLSRVAVIMSFDAYIMQDIADRFALANVSSSLGTISEGTPAASGSSQFSSRRGMGTQFRRTRARAIQTVSYNSDQGEGSPPAPPKLLVLTAYVDYKDCDYLLTSVKDDFESLARKLPNGVDGVYLEYEPDMLEPKGIKSMLKLAEMHTVGVWMLKPRDPDALSIAKKLVEECGVSYVNTDFHRDFFST